MIVVDAGAASTVIKPSPVGVSFRDKRRRAVLSGLASVIAL